MTNSTDKTSRSSAALPQTPPADAQQALLPGAGAAFRGSTVAIGIVAMVLVWSYWRPLGELVRIWLSEPDYNHGFAVPLFAGYLLYFRRGMMPHAWNCSRVWLAAGIGLILLAGGMRVAALYFRYGLLESLSLIPCLTGIVLLIGGWPMFRWAWPSLSFLIFMIPLPGFMTGVLSHPLQRIGTLASTFVLQTLGIPAVAVGNVIRLTDGEIGVVEACSGMRMLIVFFTLTVGVAFLIERPLWEKLVIVLSAAVIGIIANVVRITATGVAHELISREFADKLFHDFAGLLMPILAMLILYVEMWLLSKLLVPVESQSAPRFVRTGGAATK